jgi:perosamine synthetase
LGLSELAINGGPKVREAAWPGRGLVGREERDAVNALFDAAIASGNAPGYDGAEEAAYCAEFAEMMGGGYADAVSSGTAAVYVALKALDLEPFTEVIVPPITDPGGMMPVPLLNCIPMVADAAPGCYNTGPEQVAELISPLTSAIVVAHIAGEPADVEGIVQVAAKQGIPVIEDCAQAPGAKLNGRPVGAFGDLGAFSTMFGKHFCTGGQGGVVFTRSEEMYWKVRRASDRGKPYGLEPGSSNCVASLNLNLNDLAAAIGRAQLKKLPRIAERRREIVAGIGEGIAELQTVSLPPQLPGAEASYWFLRMRFHPEGATCDKFTYCSALGAEGLPVGAEYRAFPHEMTWYKGRRVFGTSGLPWSSPEYKGDANRTFPCPNAHEAVERHFNVHIHEGWGAQEVDDAVEILRKVDAAYRR